MLHDIIVKNGGIVCTTASNGKLGLKAYIKRLDSVKSYLKLRMKKFIRKVEKINMRVRKIKNNDEGNTKGSESFDLVSQNNNDSSYINEDKSDGSTD